MKIEIAILFLIATTAFAFSGEPGETNRVATKHILTLEGAKLAGEAAAKYAKENGAAPSIAVVDDGGHLLYFTRSETSFAAGANISIGKARTAAMFKKPTSFFEDTINKGRFTMTALPDFTPLQGGVPLIHAGEVVGAIGVSGAKTAQQDEEVAKSGAAAVSGLGKVAESAGTRTQEPNGCGSLAVMMRVKPFSYICSRGDKVV
jgi:glc operon protein GlcG